MQSQVYLWERKRCGTHKKSLDKQQKQGREQGGSKPSAGGRKEELGDFPMELWSECGLVNTSSSLPCITVM